jgi:hypothetical protein
MAKSKQKKPKPIDMTLQEVDGYVHSIAGVYEWATSEGWIFIRTSPRKKDFDFAFNMALLKEINF